MNILALPFFDDFDLLDEEGLAWKDEMDGRGWPKVGDDEEETATSESLGSFRDTKLQSGLSQHKHSVKGVRGEVKAVVPNLF